MNCMETINERLKKFRKTLKKSQQDFADTIGVKRSTYTGYENGAEIPRYVIMSLHWRYMLNIDYVEGEANEMFVVPQERMTNDNPIDSPEEVVMLKTIISNQNDYIEKLKKENQELREQLSIKERQVG